MSRIYGKGLIVLCIAAVLGGFVGSAMADYIYDYDFSRVNVGALNLQDGWNVTSGPANLMVASGATGWSGNYLQNTTTPGYGKRPNDANWAFSLVNDVSFDVSAKVLANSTKTYNEYGGLYSSDLTHKGVVVGSNTGKFYWTFAGIAYNDTAIPTATDAVYLVGWSVTANGGASYTAQRYYQNLTAGTGTVNVGASVTITSTSTYPILNLSTYWDSLVTQVINSGKLDNIRISQVPEPSTLALLACGLIGLLAYAWRKRK